MFSTRYSATSQRNNAYSLATNTLCVFRGGSNIFAVSRYLLSFPLPFCGSLSAVLATGTGLTVFKRIFEIEMACLLRESLSVTVI